MSDSKYEKLKLAEFRFWDLYLHGSQQYLGRCYAALKSGETVDPFLLPREVQDEFAFVANFVSQSLAVLFQPDLINYANLRNVIFNAWCVYGNASSLE